MKLSGYYKELGNDVELKLDYEDLQLYDKVFISKVFTDTPIDESVLNLPNVEYGGTGFFYDKAPKLPYEVEHHMPDYHLYDEWDIIVSNPPFSLKDKVLERLYSFNKPFAILLPLNSKTGLRSSLLMNQRTQNVDIFVAGD